MKNSLLSVNEVVSAVKGTAIKNIDDNVFAFTSVVTDSRQVVDGSLFVPLVGENQDGHKYIPASIEKGAVAIFLNKTEFDKQRDFYDALTEKFSNVLFVVVENTLYALQDAAAFYVQKFPALIKIGVTGSSGKTTTKEMIAACLREKYNVIANEGNLNSETGVALSAFKIRKEHEVGVFEMGMNRANEIAETANIIKPNFALVTNIGTAHVGLLGSREAIAREKKNVFNFIGKDGAVFVPSGDDFENFLCENVAGKIVKYGDVSAMGASAADAHENDASVSESDVKFIADRGFGGTAFELDGVEITLPLAGSYNYKNALGAVAVARYFDVSAKQIKHALESIGQISGRAEVENVVLKNDANVVVFKDCYNANPDSMSKAIEFCASAYGASANAATSASGNVLASGGVSATGTPSAMKKIFVLGEMYELGNDSDRAHEKVGEEIAEASPDITIFVGNEMKLAFSKAVELGYKNGVFVQATDDAAMSKIADIILCRVANNDVILLKGSRGVRLERILDLVIADDEQRKAG